MHRSLRRGGVGLPGVRLDIRIVIREYFSARGEYPTRDVSVSSADRVRPGASATPARLGVVGETSNRSPRAGRWGYSVWMFRCGRGLLSWA